MNSNSLCCCEYFDKQQNRNHILACCCNCQDLDESFDKYCIVCILYKKYILYIFLMLFGGPYNSILRAWNIFVFYVWAKMLELTAVGLTTYRFGIATNLITGKGITSENKRRFMATLQDRIRIPWYGGARHVTIDAILPIFIIPTMILIATISIWWAISIFSLMSFLLFYFYRYSLKNLQRTKFFLIWNLTSGIILFLVFEFLVVPFLEILVHENMLVIILVVGSVFCIYFVKFKSINLRYSNESQIEIGESDKLVASRSNYCPICQITVPEQDHHCVWFDCCIGIHNRFMFLFFISLAIGTLLYTANLTLTSICHPYHFYKTILLPDDCSDVYEQFEISLAFVTAVYSLMISTFLGVFFLYQIWMISIGLTGQEFTALPLSAKLCCGITAHRPYSRGFINNWLRTSCYCCRPRRPICNY